MRRTDRKAVRAAAKAAALLITDKQRKEWEKEFALDEKAVGRIIPVDELLIWRHQLPVNRLAIGPYSADRSNPIVWRHLVIASRFSPGELIALDRDTGAQVWRRRLGYYGGDVTEAEGRVLAVSGHRLLCYRAQDGRKLWEFIPYEGRETMYSLPTVVNDRVYIGDRDGLFHCVDLCSGGLIWSVLLSAYWRNNQVNVTARAFGDTIVTGNNARFCVGVERHTGAILWKRRVGTIIKGEIRELGGLAVFENTQSVYAIQPDSGEIVWRRTYPAWEVTALASADDLAVASLQNQYGMRNLPPGRKNPRRRDYISACRGGEDIYVRRIESYGFTNMRFISETGHVAARTYRGLALIQPQTGERLCTLKRLKTGRYDCEDEETDIPAVSDGVVYSLSRYGGIDAFRYPSV